MTLNVVNQAPFLRTQRTFPEDVKELCVQLNKSYIDTSTGINERTIGIYPTLRPAVNGNSLFLTSQKRQGFRQVFPITGTGAFPHGINDYANSIFLPIYGTFTDGTFWYTLPWVSVLAANNQINIFLDSVNINVTGGGGGAQPTITSGYVVLEWYAPP